MLNEQQLSQVTGILSQIKKLSVEYKLPESVVSQVVHAVLVNGATAPSVKQISTMNKIANMFGTVFELVKIKSPVLFSSGGEKKTTTGTK